VRLRLLADVVRPAEARQQEMVAEARGAAARILEEGKATAQSLTALSETWAQSGDSARQILLAQKLAPLLDAMMGTVGHAQVEKATFLDARLSSGNGGDLGTRAVVLTEQLKHTMGVDLPRLLGQLTGQASRDGAVMPEPPVP
jgi:flotillin